MREGGPAMAGTAKPFQVFSGNLSWDQRHGETFSVFRSRSDRGQKRFRRGSDLKRFRRGPFRGKGFAVIKKGLKGFTVIGDDVKRGRFRRRWDETEGFAVRGMSLTAKPFQIGPTAKPFTKSTSEKPGKVSPWLRQPVGKGGGQKGVKRFRRRSDCVGYRW